MAEKNFKVLFVYPNPRKMSLVPGSIAILTSLLKESGITVDLFDASFYKWRKQDDSDELAEKYLHVKPVMEDFKKKVRLSGEDPVEAFRLKVNEFDPDLLAVTCVESTFEHAISLLGGVRDKKILTILGGVFSTFSPDFALSFEEIDIVCRGEGEKAIVDLVNKIRSNEDYTGVDNLYIKKGSQIIRNKMAAPVDLNELPVGDFSIFDEQRLYRAMGGKIYKMAPIETHRGCTNFCTFCNSPLQNQFYKEETGRMYFRSKAVKNVYKEIKYFVDKFKVEYMFYWADNFFSYSLREIEEFCEMYSEFKLPFYCQSYPITLDEKKLKLLIKAGLHRIGIGIEHGNESFRARVLKRRYGNDDAVRRLAVLKKYGVEFSANNIIGFPDETPQLAMDTVELNRIISPNMASCSVFTPFRGTNLRQLALDKGYLKDDNILAPSNDMISVLDMPQFTKEQIEGKRRTFELYLRLPKERWKDIAAAEQLTPQGDKILKELSEEYRAAYY